MRLKHVRTSVTPKAGRRTARVGLAILGVAVTGIALAGPVQADPLWPGGPDIPGVPAIVPPDAQLPPLPKELFPQPPQSATIVPASGEVVGGLRSIDVNFTQPVTDREAAEAGVSVTSSSGTEGSFSWLDDDTLNWAPNDYWPRGTTVEVRAEGAQSNFAVSNEFTAVGDASAHNFAVKIGGDTVRTFPASFGKPTHETPNGTFGVIEKFADMVMDSSTYGVPIDAPEGYKLDVQYATRLTWSGIFVHAAPWSVDSQGNSNVSHGCINLSTANAKWYFDNVRNGDSVTLQGA